MTRLSYCFDHANQGLLTWYRWLYVLNTFSLLAWVSIIKSWMWQLKIWRLQHFSFRFFNFPHTVREDWFNWGKSEFWKWQFDIFSLFLLLGCFSGYGDWRRTKHRMVWKRQSCASIVFPIKIKEKESVRLRNLRSRITFPLNLIYPPSQSMQFHRSQTS